MNAMIFCHIGALLNESAFAPRNPYSKAVCQSSVGQVACKTAKVQLQVGAKLFMQQSPTLAKTLSAKQTAWQRTYISRTI
jgi:hypothetical protein